MPIFSLSKTGLHSDITVVPMEQWGEKQSGDVKPFAKKEQKKLLWVSPFQARLSFSSRSSSSLLSPHASARTDSHLFSLLGTLRLS